MLGAALTVGASAPPSADSGAVKVVIVGPVDSVQRLHDALVEPLARAGLVVHYELRPALDPGTLLDPAPAGTPGWAVRAVILLGDAPDHLPGVVGADPVKAAGRRVHLHLVDLHARRLLTREIPLDTIREEIAFEEIAHVVAASLRALRDGAGLDLPPPRAPARVRTALLAALDLGAERWSSRAPAVPGFGISLGAQPPGRRLQLWLSAAYHQFRPDLDPVTVRLRVPSLAALVATTFAPGGSLQFALGAGAGIGLVQATPERTANDTMSSIILAPGETRLIPFARATARAEWTITRRFALFAALTCDAMFSDGRYSIQRAGADEVLFQPGRIRPALSVGLITMVRDDER